MAASLRREILQTFKALHKTSRVVFEGDTNALKLSRNRINDEFKKNQNLNEQHQIAELLQLAKAVELELRTRVVQAKQTKPGIFEAKFRDDNVRLENVPFNETAANEADVKKSKQKCCSSKSNISPNN